MSLRPVGFEVVFASSWTAAVFDLGVAVLPKSLEAQLWGSRRIYAKGRILTLNAALQPMPDLQLQPKD